MRFILAEHRNGKGAGQALDGDLHRAQQVAVIQVIDQVGDGLGISLGMEHITQRFQFGADLFVIFDDAVVYQRDAVDAVTVG